MSRRLIDSPYIFGIHEPGGEQYMLDAGRPGWIVFSEVLGHDPEELSSVDYTGYADRGLGIIVRLNHGYEPDGAIPHSSQYEAFARRVANFVAASRGCKIWVIGNEPNYAVERPGIKVDWTRHASHRHAPPAEADPQRRSLVVRFNVLPDRSREIRTTRGAIISPGEVITPELYTRCFRLCRDAIHRIPGHEDDLVLVAPVAPWNTQTIYPGNPNGDWVQYFQDILQVLGPAGCDGFALHAYTGGSAPELIVSPARLAPPFQARHQQLRCYQDFLLAVPETMRHLPAFLTEVGQIEPWPDENTGWVQTLYAELDAWNQQPDVVKVRCAALYRWPKLDRWYIAGRSGVEEDFALALTHDYRWEEEPPPVPVEPPPAAAVARPSAAAPGAPPSGAAPQPPLLRRRRQPVTPPFLAEWIEDKFPARLSAGQTITAQITLRNVGASPWTWGGGNPFRLGYHYYRNRRLLPTTPARDLRTDIPADVQPGETVTIEARIALPDEPGNYTLELDLVQEGVAWFKESGSPTLTRWLTVEAPASQVAADGSAVQLPVRLFTDISRRLPRSGTPYARRNLNQIRYIVVSHTGVQPHVALERIAQAHIRRGYPGIAYDFVVDAAGQILRVTDMEDVAQPNQVWSEQGVNLCLAGNFGEQPPPLTQLEAAGRLCAWLAQNLGLTADAIVGLGELIRSDSPGETFYKGAAWKQVLTRQVQLHLAALGMGAVDATRFDELDDQLARLREQNAALLVQVEEARQREERLLHRAAAATQEVLDLRRQVEAQPILLEGGLRLSVVISSLPRDEARYAPRDESQIRTLIVHHTAMPAETPLEALAHAHRAEWPGILFDFVIDGRGAVFQTQPLDRAPDADADHLLRAINIAFAGDYAAGGSPRPEQLAAGGRLLNWLLQRYTYLGLDAVRGLSEVLPETVSPGAEWLTGAAWKEQLLIAVRRASGGGAVDPRMEGELRQRIAVLERELSQATNALSQADGQRVDLVEEVQRLRDEVETRAAQRAPSFIVPKPPIKSVIDQLPRHPSLRYERRPLSQITHIAIHHTAAPPRLPAARIAELHIAADPARGKDPWPGIGYHFLVQEDGVIEQTNHLETASYHVARHYSYAVGIAFAGSFMNGKIPTSTQLRAGAHLVAWLMQELKAPLARVWGHREFPDNMTVCPGGEWTQGNRWRDLLFERIEQIEKGSGLKLLRHYLLLPGRGDDSETLVNVLGYVNRFRPTVGYSVDEARSAEFVTILGGEAGVSRGAELSLAQTGCQVERIAGRDSGEIGRQLAEMVRIGRRFRTFQVDF
jgi:N-acetyl-anhydromuramyl-L-alanine amidase AmpD